MLRTRCTTTVASGGSATSTTTSITGSSSKATTTTKSAAASGNGSGSNATNNGWLSAKKRGRDDAEIAASRKKALAQRKAAAMKPSSTTATSSRSKAKRAVVPQTKKTKKKRKTVLDDYEDDDDDLSSSSSMNDFIASEEDEKDDNDVFLAESDDDDEEDDVELVLTDREEESDEDDIVEIISPPISKSKRTSKPPLRSAAMAAIPATSTTLPRTKTLESSPQTSSSAGSLGYLTSPSSPIQTNKFFAKKTTTRLPRKIKMETTNSRNSSSSDDDDDGDVLLLQGSTLKRTVATHPPPTTTTTTTATTMTTTNLRKKNPYLRPDHPRQSMDSLVSVGTTSMNSTTNIATEKSHNVLQDTPEPPSKRQPRKLEPQNRFAKFALKSSRPFDDDSDSDDIDDHNAIRVAKKESLRDQPTTTSKPRKQQKQKQKQHIQLEDSDEEEPQATEELLNDSSSDEDEVDSADDQEVRDSREQKVATSVLETASSLSAQVLATMKQWAAASSSSSSSANRQPDDNKDDDDDANGSHGLIVNGALSLGSISTTTLLPQQKDAQWISQETMGQACPGVTLSKYQLIGVNWLALLHGMKCSLVEQGGKDTPVNGVLADEMGLGKTVQTIAFLAWLKYQRRGEQSTSTYFPPHIIAVPVSVLPNWMREFQTFAPNMNVIKYHGSMAERETIQEELQNYLPGRRQYPKGCLDALLVPVTYYQKEKSDDRKYLNKFRYDYLVVDEAHMLKNSLSTRYKMLNKVKTQHRLLLTGTPVQNSPQELLNMLCFIMPLFSKGSESMDDEADDKNGTSVGDRMLQHFVDAEKQKSGDEQVAYAKLKQLFAPFVLRRKKEDVIAQLLPPKKRLVEYVELDPTARQIYNSILEDHVNKNGAKLLTNASIGEHLFTNLRKAAHHPLLLRTRYNAPSEVEHLVTHFHKYKAFAGEGSTKAKVAEELKKYNDFRIHLTALDLIEENEHRRPDLERYILDESALFSSAKFCRLQKLLPDLIQNQGHRVLIFSGWTSCLDLLGCLMEQLDLKYLRMDGSCPSDVRQARIDEFNSNSEISVFLLSTRACGLGINLTAADTCIMHDLDFNPFNDLQAEDRCHRIGQTKPVTIYKFVSQDTVDADIYEMQERKAKMNAAIMESNNSTKSTEVAKQEKQERKAMLQSAVQNFLSPNKQGSIKRLDTLEL